MKALSLWQPWASLMILGEKHIETRGWYCSHRGPLVIAATKTWKREVWEELNATELDVIADVLPDYARMLAAFRRCGIPYPTSHLPLGAALGTVNVVDCVRTEDVYALYDTGPTEDELAFGDYTPGRWAWVTETPQPFPEPIPCRGKQGLWEFDTR